MKQHTIDFPAPFQVKGNKNESLMNIDIREYSNSQLLQFIIGSESYNVLQSVGHSLNQLGQKNLYDLSKIRGIGYCKALRIMATIELGKRRHSEPVGEKIRICRSSEIFNYFYPFVGDLPHEEFWVLFLNRNNWVTGSKRIGSGGVAGVLVDPKIVFRSALENRASAVILCHNHPSGSLSPSEYDINITKKLKLAGKALDIMIPDHIIIGGNSYISLADEGLMY